MASPVRLMSPPSPLFAFYKDRTRPSADRGERSGPCLERAEEIGPEFRG